MIKAPILFTLIFALSATAIAQQYTWTDDYDSSQTIQSRVAPPDGYSRIAAAPDSFAHWLRNLPLKADGTPVYLFDGREKQDRSVYCSVIDIDVGSKDIQQCADAVIRLRAEYFYSLGLYDSIAFNFTSGDRASFRDWIKGLRPVINGNDVQWRRTGSIDSSYSNFRDYLNAVFTYAGSYSLSREMKARGDMGNVEIGDVLIQGGFPGHVVIVVDVARSNTTGKKIYLLAQGFTPAQDIHILTNPTDRDLSPWYDCTSSNPIVTPQWEFVHSDLKRW